MKDYNLPSLPFVNEEVMRHYRREMIASEGATERRKEKLLASRKELKILIKKTMMRMRRLDKIDVKHP